MSDIYIVRIFCNCDKHLGEMLVSQQLGSLFQGSVVSSVVREEWRAGATHLMATRKQTESENCPKW